jgi:hypothetical protein
LLSQHIAAWTSNIWTKAQTPIANIPIEEIKAYSLDICFTDNNPVATQYQLKTGTEYVSQSGALSDAQNWIALTDKKITVTGLNPNTTYTFTVTARNNEGVTTTSSTVSGTTFIAPPAAPSDLRQIFVAKTWVTLAWDSATGATGYDIEVDGITVNNGNSLSYTHNGLASGTAHTYAVRSRNEGGKSNWSGAVTISTIQTPPAVPANILATSTENSITLVWDNVNTATAYDLTVDGDMFATVASPAYTITGLEPATSHTFVVKAVNSGGSSAGSMLVNVSTIGHVLGSPVNISIIPQYGGVLLSWDAVAGAIGYNIKVNANEPIYIVDTVYQDIGLIQGEIRTYSIRAVYPEEYGEWSSEATGAALVDPPVIPEDTVPDPPEVTPGEEEWGANTGDASLNPVYTIDCVQNEVFNLVMGASGIEDCNQLKVTVTYDPNELEILDACCLTPNEELSAGIVDGTDIRITQLTPGTLVFIVSKAVASGQGWSGVVNCIKFKASTDGQSTITCSILRGGN